MWGSTTTLLCPSLKPTFEFWGEIELSTWLGCKKLLLCCVALHFANASILAFTKHSGHPNSPFGRSLWSILHLSSKTHFFFVQRPFGRALYGCDAERGRSEHAVVPGWAPAHGQRPGPASAAGVQHEQWPSLSTSEKHTQTHTHRTCYLS